MKIKARFCNVAAIIAVCLASPAFSQGIQMLPPIQSGTADTLCPAGALGQVLSWDGVNPIHCQTGVVVDNAGRVGIGTAPTRTLDVNGTFNANGAIRMNAANVGGLLTGLNPSSAGWAGRELVLTLADGAGNDNDGIWIGPNVSAAAGGPGWVRLHANHIAMTGSDVHVGIGTLSPNATLDISGGVRIGMDPAACVGAKAGTLRYNAGQVQVCNGTSWGNAFGGMTTYAKSNEGSLNLGPHKFCALTRVQSQGWGSATAWYCDVSLVGTDWVLSSHFQRDAENMPGRCRCRATCMD